jgi:hypothetical protein
MHNVEENHAFDTITPTKNKIVYKLWRLERYVSVEVFAGTTNTEVHSNRLVEAYVCSNRH